ncbi:DUF1559 domain-containing protein [Blastopirellula marina]|uniref:Prepilin-type cleavage/methylation domain-containing protein n=1 Tax=Blastopirellula marina TaxID=124 RepID=A0A2S8GM27_9BACT|nr:DUF1559 domain-containing protein [Blastopirellula marina]PQO45480.1 prepilin-type cleavage/methylation domain-containing protein [Blastopirellula marina]
MNEIRQKSGVWRAVVDSRRGVTLVELLVVIAIIGGLIAILLPSIQQARESARRAECLNNLKQHGLAFQSYHATHNCFPFGWNFTQDFNVSGWTIQLLPYVEQNALYSKWDPRVPAVNEASSAFGFPEAAVTGNLEVIQVPLDVFMCPSAPGDTFHNYGAKANAYGPGKPPVDLTWAAARGDYSATSGIHDYFSALAYSEAPPKSRRGILWQTGIGGKSKCPRLADVVDGASNTTLLGERLGGSNIYKGRSIDGDATAQIGMSQGGGWGDFLIGEHWIQGSLHDGTMTEYGGPYGINCSNGRSVGYFAFHPGGANFLLADGSVTFIRDTISAHALASYITYENGEVFDR